LKFFEQFDEIKKNNLSGVIELEQYKKNEVVIKIDTYGDKFYIILKGSVWILVRN